MGLFGRKKAGPTGPASGRAGALDSGRRFSSSLAPSAAVSAVQQLIDSYGAGPIAPAEFSWHGPADQTPVEVYVANIARAAHPGNYLVISFRPAGSGTEIGVFPEGVGDARLTIPFAGNLKMLDNSLSSTGTIPGGQLALSTSPGP